CFHAILSNKLDPVPIWIQQKCDICICSILQLLMELIPFILKPLAGRLDMVDADADIAKPPKWFHIAIINFIRVVILGAVIVCQLKDSFSVCPVLAVMQRLLRVVCKEVEGEFGVGEIELFND